MDTTSSGFMCADNVDVVWLLHLHGESLHLLTFLIKEGLHQVRFSRHKNSKKHVLPPETAD